MIPDNKPARAGHAGIGKLRKLLLGPFEGLQETLRCRSAVLLKVGRDFAYFRRGPRVKRRTRTHLLS